MFLFRVQNPLDLEMLPACMLMNMEREANYGDFLLPCHYDQTDLVASLPAYRAPDFFLIIGSIRLRRSRTIPVLLCTAEVSGDLCRTSRHFGNQRMFDVTVCSSACWWQIAVSLC